MSARTACLVLVAAAFVAGCGDAAPDPREPASDTGSASAAAEGVPVRPGDSPVPAPAPPASSSITADTELEDRPGGTSIRVTLTGLEPGARYPVQVREDPCGGSGRVRLPLGRVTGRPDGTGSVRMTVAAERLPARPFSVHVQDPSGSPVACTEIHPEPREP